MIRPDGDAGLPALRPFDFYTGTTMPVLLVPMAGVAIRGSHNAGFFSGLWLFAGLVAVVGALMRMVICALPARTGTTVHGPPKTGPVAAGKRERPVDAQKRAIQAPAPLFDKDRPVTPELETARTAEISDYDRSRVLKPAANL